MPIDYYDFGEIMIDNKTYHEDVIVYPHKVKSGWWRKEGHHLHKVDLFDVIHFSPELLLIGTGFNGRMQVPSELVTELEQDIDQVIVKNSREAVRLFNELMGEDKKAVLAIHLTC